VALSSYIIMFCWGLVVDIGWEAEPIARSPRAEPRLPMKADAAALE